MTEWAYGCLQFQQSSLVYLHLSDHYFCLSIFLFNQIPIPMADLITVPNASVASSSSSSSSISYSHFDVFINHRGPDVKETFASDLYRRLVDHRLRVFLDKPELEAGHTILSQIEAAIQVASVHIAIFSPTYADSNWCLDELVLMVKSLETGATILPVFYNVKPSELRWTGKDKIGAYAKALRKLEEKTTSDSETGEQKPRYHSDTIQNWRKALSQVADISGFELDGDGENLLNKVVRSVLKFVPKSRLYVAKYPTGLEEKLQGFEATVLSSQEREETLKTTIVGIVGAGGIGKTTLAKEFFNSKSSLYNKSSFLFDVRENGAKLSQMKLIMDLTYRDIKIENAEEGIAIIKQHLAHCHALIVLDDVNNVHQLEVLLPIKDILRFHSLILVTSRDKHVLISSGIPESSIYKLTGLNKSHSQELFCSYAFYQPHPPPEFADLVERFLMVCDGLPLSLKVFGALVCGANDESFWQEILSRLDNILPTTEIQERLKISYDTLSSNDQQIFLDIACFFIREDRDTVGRICGMIEVRNLENKCLLEVDNENNIKMHDHFRDLARNVANDGLMPRRLWQEITNNIDVLLEQSVTTNVRGITMVGRHEFYQKNTFLLKSSEVPWYQRCRDELFGNCLRHLINNSSFSGISNLQFVASEDGHYLERILRRVRSPHLTWLRWYKCGYSRLPSWIPMENLRVMQVAGGKLRLLWQRDSEAPLQLRELNVWAPALSAFPRSIGHLKHLEKFVIMDAVLITLPEEFGDLSSLKYLQLTRCSNLIWLPDSFGNLTRLQHLELWGCSNLTISKATLGNITTLEYLDLSYCEKVKELPPQVAHQRSLQKLQISGTNLKEFQELPGSIVELCNLEVLELGGPLLEVLPSWLGYLESLNFLYLLKSPKLKCLPDSFGLLTELTHLDIRHCGIEYLPQDLLKMSNLKILGVRECPLQEHPFRGGKLDDSHYNGMLGLEKLVLQSTQISEVFFLEGCCPNLKYLDLSDSGELRQIGLCGQVKLEHLDINWCKKLVGLSSLETLVSLEELWAFGCHKLKSIQGLGHLRKLRTLDVSECSELQELPGVENCISLEELDASDCPKLQWDVGVVEQLRQQLKEELIID